MKKLFLAVVLVATLTNIGCKSGGGDPKAVLTAFFDALAKKDIAAARKLATAESKSMLDMMEMGMKMANESKDQDKYDKSKMEFGEPKIEGDKATVPVKEKSSGETTNFTLKKEEGAWKVAFDKSSMMQMGMDKMKDGGAAADSLNEAVDKLKDMNMDSVKDAMKKGIEALDSVKDILKDIKTN